MRINGHTPPIYSTVNKQTTRQQQQKKTRNRERMTSESESDREKVKMKFIDKSKLYEQNKKKT